MIFARGVVILFAHLFAHFPTCLLAWNLTSPRFSAFHEGHWVLRNFYQNMAFQSPFLNIPHLQLELAPHHHKGLLKRQVLGPGPECQFLHGVASGGKFYAFVFISRLRRSGQPCESST
jgi:hypothetical protein